MMQAVSWVMGHQALMAGLGVAVMDLVMALIPSVQSNGLLHWVYNLLLSKKSA